MKKFNLITSLSVLAACLLTTSVYAAPVILSEIQMDAVAAGGVARVEGFVCPVISTDAILKNSTKNGSIVINGAYSIRGPDISVPLHATNDNGAGSPGDTFASPGDTGYTAIWSN